MDIISANGARGSHMSGCNSLSQQGFKISSVQSHRTRQSSHFVFTDHFEDDNPRRSLLFIWYLFTFKKDGVLDKRRNIQRDKACLMELSV